MRGLNKLCETEGPCAQAVCWHIRFANLRSYQGFKGRGDINKVLPLTVTHFHFLPRPPNPANYFYTEPG